MKLLFKLLQGDLRKTNLHCTSGSCSALCSIATEIFDKLLYDMSS